MSVHPLKSLGFWRGKEMAVESFLPITISGYCIWKIKGLVSTVAVGKPLTSTELFVFLGVLVAIVSWATSRQVYLMGRRKPSWIAFFSCMISLGVIFTLSKLASSGFVASCVDVHGGAIIDSKGFLLESGGSVCQIGGVAGNGYLTGTLLRPAWNGELSLIMWLSFFMISLISAIAFRDRRFIATSMIIKLYKLLEYASATGVAGCLGGKSKDGKVFACANPTLWGEICGQLYSGSYQFEPGEWCGRCGQPFQKSERNLTFSVVSLFTDNIDLLNMLEKKDTLSWDITKNAKIPGDGRQSGVERWVVLGQITVPDVISVSQLISLIHSQFPLWSGDDERKKNAINLAKKRASRLYGWIWFGNQTKRLTYAKPTNKVLMAMGTTRLRDLITDSGDSLYFQLDVGLLPVEMRSAFHATFIDENRKALFQNSKYDLWIPIAPKLSAKLAGLWVPRIEGEALRKWLSIGRLQEKGKRGVTVPKPYYLNQDALDRNILLLPDKEELAIEPNLDKQESRDQKSQKELIAFFEEEEDDSFTPFYESTDSSDDTDIVIKKEVTAVVEEIQEDQSVEIPSIKQGSLDIVMAPYFDQYETEPKLSAVGLGDSIAEWEWLEPEQIQRMRRQCLVLVDMNSYRQ